MAASNFAKGMVIGLQVGAASAKPPVLTELTVTENGVYDNPAIVKAPVIAVSETLKFKSSNITLPQVIQDELMNIGESIIFLQDNVLVMAVMQPEFFVINYNDECAYLSQSYCDEFMGGIESGWYDVNMENRVEAPSFTVADGYYAPLNPEEVACLFEGTSTPADGWNKVTVNVPGDIVDVPELPTEGIEQDKVYRVAGEEYVEGCFVKYGDVYLDASDNEGPILAPILGQAPEYYTVEYILVDELPPKSEMKTSDPSVRGDLYVYIVRSTGKGYVYDLSLADGATGEIGAVECWFNYNIGEDVIGGVVSDKSEIPEDDMWYTVIKKQPDFYGIPDEANNKTVFEHTSAGGWVEVGASEPCTHVPNMVPNDGSYIENVYFNGSLSTEQVLAEIDKIPEECWILGEIDTYLVFELGDLSQFCRIIRMATEDGGGVMYQIFIEGDEYYCCIRYDDGVECVTDWDVTEANIHGDSVTHFSMDDSFRMGTANHLLTNLISIRPFDAN